jgi:hypothetical protein
MSTYGLQQATPQQTRRAVLLYSVAVPLAAIAAEIISGGLTLFVIVPAIIVCAAVGLIGILLAWGPPPPGPGPTMIVVPAVVILILGCYLYSHSNQSAILALAAGVASALAWALSVVGALIWGHFGIASSAYWNSWFNLFAAAFAALTVGYTPVT